MLNIGLLGASKIAPSAIIAPAADVDGVQVSAVAARDPVKANHFAREHAIPAVFSSYEDLIESKDIDIVYVGLPPSHHAYWSIKALKAGKHVLCEKPTAMNVEEARAMVAVAQSTGARLVEAMHPRYHPGFALCQDWVSKGLIGTITKLQAHFGVPLEDDGVRNQYRREAGGGSVMDMGCYPLNWVAAFAGAGIKAIDAKPVMASSGVDASMTAHLIFTNGVSADIACSMVGPGEFSAGLTLHGTKGRIAFQDPLVPYKNGTLTRICGDIRQTEKLSTKTTYYYQLLALVDALETGRGLVTEGQAIIEQQKRIDDVYAAAGLSHLREPVDRVDDLL